MIIILLKNLELLEQFAINWLHMFSTPPEKDGKGSKILGKKDKLVLSTTHPTEDPLEFCDYL